MKLYSVFKIKYQWGHYISADIGIFYIGIYGMHHSSMSDETLHNKQLRGHVKTVRRLQYESNKHICQPRSGEAV
ncbi:hypothetical protein pVco7_gp047 [Vibrio phage pVco-7]